MERIGVARQDRRREVARKAKKKVRGGKEENHREW